MQLAPKEYALLARLAGGRGEVLTHKELLVDVRGPAHREDTQYLRVAIRHFRQKLEADFANPAQIVTEPGIGYRLVTK